MAAVAEEADENQFGSRVAAKRSSTEGCLALEEYQMN